jgi:cobalt-zinc-cadmium efflux system outer membrane protein
MKSFIVVALFLCAAPALGQDQGRDSTLAVSMYSLIKEAQEHNPEIHAAAYQMDAAAAKVSATGVLDDPQLTYMREEMPGFRFREAMFSKIELMQTFRFPSKLSKETELAEIRAQHAHHEHEEKRREVLSRLKWAFAELWYIQQAAKLNEENEHLLMQFVQVARARYSVGEAMQQDVLKAQVELARIGNQMISLRQQERAAKAMLMAILNRNVSDTLGVAILPDEPGSIPSLDTLKFLALRSRPMLMHDSLSVVESNAMVSLARREFLPDLRLGLTYVTGPREGFTGWSITAGISLPFAPWTISRAGARKEEAEASVMRSSALYNASRNMVLSEITELFSKARSFQDQITTYRSVILPQAGQSLRASMIAYQTGTSDFLMLMDSYRTRVELKMESLMRRMEFEKTMAQLERAVGVDGIVIPNGLKGGQQ